MRSGRAAGLTALTVISIVPVASQAGDEARSPALCGRGPLEILLTNDDGYQAPGIRALYDELRKAGHHVRLAAPATNSSGSSASFKWGTVSVIRDAADPGIIGIDATPATSVVLAATALYPAGGGPDLVVSGINDGDNTGALLAMSGTVGAALAGAMLLDPPIPGIAINAQRASTPEQARELPADQPHAIARHVTRIVNMARTWFCKDGRLVRPASVLNVNYPARPVADVRGVRVATQGHTAGLRLVFEPSGADRYSPRIDSSNAVSDDPDSDVALLAQGYVTVTPISAFLFTSGAPAAELERALARSGLEAP